MASEFAVSEVFHQRKPHSRISQLAVPLQNSEQLRDHDEAYSEAQALLGDWLNSKLRMELEVDDDDDPPFSDEKTHSSPPANQSSCPTYNNFDDLYNCLVEEEEQTSVNSILQDLMKREVLNSGMVEEMALDDQITQKKFKDPTVTMEARHQQVRENRARREAERQRQHRQRQDQKDARKEAKRREQEKEMRKKQKERKEEEMVQQEMVRLRRQIQERREQERLLRERKRAELQMAAKDVQSIPTLPTKQRRDPERLHQEQKIQTKIHMSNLKCLQRHFSGWFSVVLDRKLRMDKAMVFSDWRMQLRAWRAWRVVVWTEKRQQEVARTEEALRMEKRQMQLAVESDRRRLLRRCLNEWLLWCQKEKLLAQRQKTKREMAAFLGAVSTGTFKTTETSSFQSDIPPPKPLYESETKKKKDHHMSDILPRDNSAVNQGKTSLGNVSQSFEPWQVTRHHTALTAPELHKARQRIEDDVLTSSKTKVSTGSRFENRHIGQQQIITQQRKLLKEQQEQIAQLKEKEKMLALEKELETTAQLSRPSVQRAPRVTGEPDSQSAPSRKTVTQQTCRHPIVTAMEARAQQRAERRKQIEELKRKKEEEKLAEKKAAAEQRQREEEEEKHKAAEKRREEKRLEREREEEKQRELKRQQQLTIVARQHYHKTLLSRWGLAPWKCLIQIRQARLELAEHHHSLFILRRCTLQWKQSATESLLEKEARADRLYQHILVQRSLTCWKKLRDMQMILEERAERFYRKRTLRRFLLALLDYVTQERLLEWDHEELAQEHNNRRVVRQCFLAWRQLPRVMRRERERDERRKKLSRKVAEVLPDFSL
ncbi:coiled-coil domain-containing protein 191 [Cololabis saira]|uniref:coiled-coil domain-containing protein 191 n=1 Tax=Cololabis saira TaxID=129043 RepID=UPI002AD48DCB|nr:coiled-coil domain-containing protein 191 [Cololabis saira]